MTVAGGCVRRRDVAACLAVLGITACAASGPGYELEVFVQPRTTPIAETVQLHLIDQGYEIRDQVQRSMSVTISGLRIRAGDDRGILLYEWLHVTISEPSRVTGFGDPSFVVEVRAETEREGRERVTVPPSAEVIADADRLVAVLRRGR